MKKIYITIYSLLFAASSYAQQTISAFEPNLFTEIPNARDISISANGNELYFTAQSVKQDFSAIMLSTKFNNEWTSPEVASFSGQYKDLEPFLSQNGLTMYFASNRPVKGREGEKPNYDIWKVERASLSSEWSTPLNLGAPVNTEADEFYPSVATNGNLYFTAAKEDAKGKEDIYISTLEIGSYSIPESLSESINSEGYEFNAFVASDESYIIFTGYRREGGLGRGDLYISKKDEQGNWQESTHFENGINSKGIDYCPFVQNGVLYFTSDRSSLRTSYDTPLTTQEFLDELSKTENGKSRIYKVEAINWLTNE